MQFNFNEKTIIVTGGSKGIGSGIVTELANAGANVVFTYNKNQELAELLLSQLVAYEGKIKAFPMDVTQPESVQAMMTFATTTFGPLYGLVNNAGIRSDRAFYSMEFQEWDTVFQTNVNGVFHVTQHFVRSILRTGGRILNIASVSGLHGMPGQANYSSSKGALIAMTKTLAKELAPFNIQVNAIAPGYIETDMVASMPEKEKEKIPLKIPLKRLGTIEEVAKAACYFLAPDSSYITGQTLTIDGGLSI